MHTTKLLSTTTVPRRFGGVRHLVAGAVDDAGAILDNIEGVAGLADLHDRRPGLHMQRPQRRAEL